MPTITTADVERFRTTDRHLELVRSGAVQPVRIAGKTAVYRVAERLVAVSRRDDTWVVNTCECKAWHFGRTCYHALAVVEAELVRLFSLGAHAGYRAAKREAVR